ncbi:MAG: hypothetical protein KF825_13335 [Ferruginibacter sp.]|nr:hypothetical protein [Ferruginibacter sp.]
MKPIYRGFLLFACILITAITLNSCAKKDHSTDLPKEQQIVGQWGINRVQLRLYSGTTFLKDTIIPNIPKPKNYIVFDAGSGFEFKYNSATSNTGTYQFSGTDSLIAVTPGVTYRWKMLTMTNVLFTIMNTSTNDPAFPGLKVETYFTLTR